MSPPDIVMLSPHLDDVVLSVGALLARRIAEGRSIEVWTFFTKAPPLSEIPPERRVFGDYATRLAEDVRALDHLGAGHRWLGFVERIWRSPALERTYHVFRTPPIASELGNLTAMREVIGNLLDEPDTLIYAPLGVGNHVDHVEVALAAAHEVIERGAYHRALFYEDPYAQGAACRRRHYVTRRRPFPPLGGPAWASPRVGALLRAVAAWGRGPGVDAYLPAAAALDWQFTVEPVDRFEDAKLAAIGRYASQVTTFGGQHRLESYLRRAHRTLGGELIWRIAGPLPPA